MHRGLLPYLQDYAGGLIVIYHLVNDWLEEVLITFGERGGFVMALEHKDQEGQAQGARGKGGEHLLWSSMPSRRGTLRQ